MLCNDIHEDPGGYLCQTVPSINLQTVGFTGMCTIGTDTPSHTQNNTKQAANNIHDLNNDTDDTDYSHH